MANANNLLEHLIQETVLWNTNALYTEQGQRICAFRLKDGSVVFADIDRGIEGRIPAGFMQGAGTRERVMQGYMSSKVEYWISGTDWSTGGECETVRALQQMAIRRAIDSAPPKHHADRYTGH